MRVEHPAVASLLGVAVGDAFGSRILLPGDHPDVVGRVVPAAPWAWSDDTEMACSVCLNLQRYGEIEQDALAASFAERFDPDRGYGSGVERMLLRYRKGESWRDVAPSVFGMGSWGNGGAMRVAPLGAWFGADLDTVVDQASKSAVVTHAHSEGVAGAVAVAVAAALAATRADLDPGEMLNAVAARVPDSEVRRQVQVASGIAGDRPIAEVASVLGNGREVSAVDTVPLAVWIAAYHMGAYEDALWTIAQVAEDVDTVCAIAGGIIAARAGSAAIPAEWRAACEPLPLWFTQPGWPGR